LLKGESTQPIKISDKYAQFNAFQRGKKMNSQDCGRISRLYNMPANPGSMFLCQTQVKPKNPIIQNLS
jgi:hypothetical protein